MQSVVNMPAPRRRCYITPLCAPDLPPPGSLIATGTFGNLDALSYFRLKRRACNTSWLLRQCCKDLTTRNGNVRTLRHKGHGHQSRVCMSGALRECNCDTTKGTQRHDLRVYLVFNNTRRCCIANKRANILQRGPSLLASRESWRRDLERDTRSLVSLGSFSLWTGSGLSRTLPFVSTRTVGHNPPAACHKDQYRLRPQRRGDSHAAIGRRGGEGLRIPYTHARTTGAPVPVEGRRFHPCLCHCTP